MDNIAIEVKDLSKIYKLYQKPSDRLKESLNPSKKKYHEDFYALSDISFQVKKGETIGIIGQNGSGKSTLLKIITGVLSKTHGDVKVNGKISALLELGAGFNPEYTGIENIYLNGTVMGYSKKEIEDKLDNILSFADIGEFIYQPVKTYSSGMFVRLAFAVAINIDPDILIVDEALAVGDMFFQSKCYRKFAEFMEQGKTIIFVTHDLDSIIKYCDRAIVLDNGIKIEEGIPTEMVDVYKKLLVGCYTNSSSVESQEILEDKNDISWRLDLPVNPNHLEYGNKSAEIIDYGIFDREGRLTNKIYKNEEIEFRIKIRFHKDIENPIFAYTIKNIKGSEITGTNTMVENVITGKFKKGDTAVVSFKQKFKLHTQNYMISFGCTGFNGDKLVVYHRLYDILIFSLMSNKNTVGIFDPESIIQIKNYSKS